MSFGIPVRNGLSISLFSTTSLSSGRGLRPSLALNFLSGTLDSRITFTRSSSATRVNASGVIESVTANTPRFDYDPVTLAPNGLLIEEQRTNLLLRSEEFDNAVWAKSSVTVSANAITSPDGTVDADTLTATGANGTVTQSVSTSAIAMTFSVYLRRKSGTGNVQITADGSTWATQAVNSSTWTRCIVTQTALVGTTSPGIRIVTSGDEVYAWGAQYE